MTIFSNASLPLDFFLSQLKIQGQEKQQYYILLCVCVHMCTCCGIYVCTSASVCVLRLVELGGQCQ